MADVLADGGAYTLPSCGFTAPANKRFIGWKANNSGDTLAAGAQYDLSADVTFYAQWANTYTVTYNANEGTGTMTDSNSPYLTGSTVTVLSNTFTAPTGMHFDHWDTASDDSGTDYSPTDTFTISGNVILYAIWQSGEGPQSGDVTFTAGTDEGSNGSSGNSDSMTKSVITISGTNLATTTAQYRIYQDCELTISTSAGNITNIVFAGADTSYPMTRLSTETGTYTVTNNNGSWEGAAPSVVFSASSQARASSITVTFASGTVYTITYDSNGGSGSMSSTVGSSPAVASCSFTAPEGKVFFEWNSEADGSGEDYSVGDTLSESITLYAQWTEEVGANVTMTAGENSSVSEIKTLGNETKTAIKCGTSGNAGVMTLTLKAANITKIKAYIAAWNNDGTTIGVTVSSGTISPTSIEPESDSGISGSTTPYNLSGAETTYKVEFTLTSVPNDGVITLTAQAASKNRFVVWGATDLFAETFASKFNSNLSCNSSGTSEPTYTNDYSWTGFQTLYNSLDTEEKGRLHDASANQSGTAIEQAMARYDYIVGKYNKGLGMTSKYPDFINRDPAAIASSSRVALFAIGDNSNAVSLVIIVISMIGLTAVGGYFFMRKKKEQ